MFRCVFISSLETRSPYWPAFEKIDDTAKAKTPKPNKAWRYRLGRLGFYSGGDFCLILGSSVDFAFSVCSSFSLLGSGVVENERIG